MGNNGVVGGETLLSEKRSNLLHSSEYYRNLLFCVVGVTHHFSFALIAS
jgi:hypothetical protein